MPLYDYQAIDSKGKKVKGLIDGNSENDAKRKLREQGIMVTKLNIKKKMSSRENLKGEKLVLFTIQLSQLVGSGVPLYESLTALEDLYRKESFHRIILSLCERIKGGASLSEAMSEFPGSFSKLYCSMITAGESSGSLSDVLIRLSDYLMKQDKMKKEIQTALIYPAILGCFALVVISVMLGFVIPSVQGIFSEQKLNSYTEFVLNVSFVFRNYWWVYLPIIILSIGYLVYYMRTPGGKIKIEKIAMRIPIINTLLVEAAMARFCRTMGTLQKGGLTILDSLHISREVMGNAILEAEMKSAETKIMEGSSLSVELNRSRWIPSLVSRMIAVSEESGSSSEMLYKIADMYEEHLDRTLNRILALAQPVILMVMGLIIGSILLAVLFPLTDISSFSLT
jgi:general secretion pathway protein F/type IV pilus assembly protein PilC